MTMLMNATKSDTMSSREIAELTGSTHDNVLKTIRALIQKGVVSGNETPYTHPQNGQTYIEFALDYRNTMVIVSGYNVEIRARIIDRWQELEAKQAPAIPQTFAQALRLAADLQDQLAIAAPKAIALDRIADTESLFTIRDAAKATKTKERDLVALLLRRGWAYRDSRNVMQPYAEKIAAGYVTSVVTKPITGQDGQDRVFTQLRITAKGVTRLSYLAAKGVAA